MIHLAANLSFLFADLPFLDRIDAAAAAGFRGVECLFPYAHLARDIRTRCDAAGLSMVLFNAPPGDWNAGDRGLAAIPARRAEFRESLERALDYAAALGSPLLHVMAGLYPPSDRQSARSCYCDNLAYAADRAARLGIGITIEPLNAFDVPGYFLRNLGEALDVLDSVRHPALGLQFDFYHQQIIGGDLTRSFETAAPWVRHVQIAGVPGRSEPDQGEINPHFLLRMIEASGYRGWIGCEYRPHADTLEGLGWARPYLAR